MFFRWNRFTIFDRKHLDICVLRECVIKTDDLPGHLDYVYLGMRDAARFDNVFNRCFLRQPTVDKSEAPCRVDKEIEVAVKMQPDGERLHVNLRFARWRRRTQR